MSDPDLAKYLTIVEEIKARYRVAGEFYDGTLHARFDVPTIEFVALQIRFMCELVALSSLSANKEIFEENRIKFSNKWQPSEVLTDISRLNPNFYPKPLIERKDPKTGNRELLDLTEDFLTQEELIRIHGVCGNLLHARNPFKAPLNYGEYKNQFSHWGRMILNLLQVHKIQLLDTNVFYLVHLNGQVPGGSRAYKFVPTDANPAVERDAAP